MDDALALARLQGVLTLIDNWGDLYAQRWGYGPAHYEDPGLDVLVRRQIDEVRQRTKLAHDIIMAMGERELATRVVEHEEGPFRGHPFTQARVAILEAIAMLSQREELAEILGPVGPRLSASELNPTIWGAAAALWDGKHYRAAVQTSATALEGLLQSHAGPAISGENLASLFSTKAPSQGQPRLRLRDLDPESKTWASAQEGAASLVRGAFMAVRNLVSHPGWPDPSPGEALEMLAVLSYVARLVDRCDIQCVGSSKHIPADPARPNAGKPAEDHSP